MPCFVTKFFLLNSKRTCELIVVLKGIKIKQKQNPLKNTPNRAFFFWNFKDVNQNGVIYPVKSATQRLRIPSLRSKRFRAV